MNPLTLVKRIQSINAKEADLGISDEASWHAKYKDSAYVFVGGIPYDLTEGDLLAVFAQYGEIVDVNLVRDKATGKSKGFSFVAYEDQRSTVLAVDNLNGAQIAGRTIRVDHVSKYKKKEEEDEETERQKREERGVCRAFQKGECKYGDSCRFSHDEQRAANTGWGPEEDRRAKSAHDKFNNGPGPIKRRDDPPPSRASKENRVDDFDRKGSRAKDNTKTEHKQIEDVRERGPEDRRSKWSHDKFNNRSGLPPNPPPRHASKENQADDLDRKRSRGNDRMQTECEEGRDNRTVERRSVRYEPESKSRDDYDGREEKRSRNNREKEREKRSSYSTRDSSPRSKNTKDEDQRRKERRVDDHVRDKRDDDYRRSHR